MKIKKGNQKCDECMNILIPFQISDVGDIFYACRRCGAVYVLDMDGRNRGGLE